jgi:hypothetical protein
MLIVTGLGRSEVERVTRALCRFEDSAVVPTPWRDGAATAVRHWLPSQGVSHVGFVEVARHAAWTMTSADLHAVVDELAPRSVARQVTLPLAPQRERGPTPGAEGSASEHGVLVVLNETPDAARPRSAAAA